MKKLIKWFFIVVILFSILGSCFGGESSDNVDDTQDNVIEKDYDDETINQSEKDDNEEKINGIEDVISKYNDSLFVFQMQEVWSYANDNKIPVYDFSERKELAKFVKKSNIQNILNNLISIEEEYGEYKRILSDNTELFYYGEMNDEGRPDGLGMILEYGHIESIDDRLLTFSVGTGYTINYTGYFKDGKYDGYGIYTGAQKLQGKDLSEKIIIQEEPLVVTGSIIHEGYYKEGENSGKGNYYFKNMMADELMYITKVGEMKDDNFNGYVEEYYGGTLIYKGEQKYGEYVEGTEYYSDTGSIKYEGEYRNGVYDGKGILYEKDGSIIYKGEFSDGDIK